MAPNYFPVFSQLRFDPTATEAAETIEVMLPMASRFAKLLTFNKVEVSKIIEEAKKELGSESSADKDLLSEHIRQNITDIAVRLRLAENTPAYQSENSGTKSHSGFVAKVLLTHPADPTKTKEKSVKVVAMTREGIEEKKKLLEHMFNGVISAANRLDVSPEKLGNIFSALCPENAGGADQDIGAHIGDAMGQMGNVMGGMMQGMMGAMGGAPPGAAGRGGPGGPPGAGGPECKQQ